MSERAIALLEKVLAHITEHPETWDQWSFRRWNGFRTVFCFAGHLIQFAAADPTFDKSYLHRQTDDAGMTYWWLKPGAAPSTGDFAAGIVGLTDDEKRRLFYDDALTLEGIRSLVDEFTAVRR